MGLKVKRFQIIKPLAQGYYIVVYRAFNHVELRAQKAMR